MKRHKQKKYEEVAVGNVTVKIYTREKSGGYRVHEVSDYSTGARRLRSFSDHDEAVKEATRIAELMAAGEVQGAQMLGADRASYGRSVELIRPTGMALELVASHFAEAYRILGGDRVIEAAKYFVKRNPDSLPARTVAQVKDELLAAKEARGKSKRYLEDLRARLSRFADAFQTDVASVTTGDVQRWLDGLKVEAQTIVNYRRVVSNLFRFAEARGYIFKGSNPVSDTEKVSGSNGDSVEIYTPEQLTKLLAGAKASFRPCIALGAFAGLRSAEIERLSFDDIDLRGKLITLSAGKTKTASRRIVPIVPALSAWLVPYAKAKGQVWKKTHEEFYDAQKETADASGIKWKTNGLRHSFASYRLADVKSAAQVSLECGNSAAVVFKHYREIVKPKDAKRWFAIRPKDADNVVNLETKAAS
jgi:integrase